MAWTDLPSLPHRTDESLLLFVFSDARSRTSSTRSTAAGPATGWTTTSWILNASTIQMLERAGSRRSETPLAESRDDGYSRGQTSKYLYSSN